MARSSRAQEGLVVGRENPEEDQSRYSWCAWVTSNMRRRLQQAEISRVKNGIKIGLYRDKFFC